LYEKDLEMEIEQFDSNFEQNLQTVQQIEDQVIKPLVLLLNLPIESYKMQEMD